MYCQCSSVRQERRRRTHLNLKRICIQRRKKTPHSCDYEDSYNSSKSQTYSETELYTPLSTLFHCLDAKVEVGNQKECILKKTTPVEKTAFLEQGIRNCSEHQKE
mmetsp:Transcript_20860/g.35777  ORF Transcript_20860/g.35777 Transcript_20860/m.35777 type:complete len:105 (+) Transcript_20860:93-407(+)